MNSSERDHESNCKQNNLSYYNKIKIASIQNQKDFPSSPIDTKFIIAAILS